MALLSVDHGEHDQSESKGDADVSHGTVTHVVDNDGSGAGEHERERSDKFAKPFFISNTLHARNPPNELKRSHAAEGEALQSLNTHPSTLSLRCNAWLRRLFVVKVDTSEQPKLRNFVVAKMIKINYLDIRLLFSVSLYGGKYEPNGKSIILGDDVCDAKRLIRPVAPIPGKPIF